MPPLRSGVTVLVHVRRSTENFSSHNFLQKAYWYLQCPGLICVNLRVNTLKNTREKWVCVALICKKARPLSPFACASIFQPIARFLRKYSYLLPSSFFHVFFLELIFFQRVGRLPSRWLISKAADLLIWKENTFTTLLFANNTCLYRALKSPKNIKIGSKERGRY